MIVVLSKSETRPSMMIPGNEKPKTGRNHPLQMMMDPFMIFHLLKTQSIHDLKYCCPKIKWLQEQMVHIKRTSYKVIKMLNNTRTDNY
ncbi:hypothetical protein GDO81_014714 [Engystomops pustulosus]|uniref:Uncharacterized protein n=1 Tax=Engystomops pustulosus TaxID=76066 RepID=A0AAV7BC59_ENGPU|nr:hypothetical protein GDO81_014714 [Engystomops pustulosus]